MGFGIYRGLIGHIDKGVPANLLLGGSEESHLLWDYATPPTEEPGGDGGRPVRGGRGRSLEAAGGIEPPYGALQAPA